MEAMYDFVHIPGHAEGCCARSVVKHNSDAEVLRRVPVNAMWIALEEVLVQVFGTGPVGERYTEVIDDQTELDTVRLMRE